MESELLMINESKISQAKYLPILTPILQTIGNNMVSVKLLEQKLQAWSLEKKKNSEFYREHNGILTHKTSDKPTTAFKYYIDFLIELKLLVKQNDFVRCSKYGLLFNVLYTELKTEEDFSEFEKLFYSFFLFTYDADNLLLILDYLFAENKAVKQSQISQNYRDLLKTRLEHKYQITENSEVRNKYLNLLNQKINSKTPSKHIIPPRIEWLSDLRIIEETQKDVFRLSKNGHYFYTSLPVNDIKISKITNINNEWYENNSITSFSKLFTNRQLFHSLELETNKTFDISSVNLHFDYAFC